MILNTRTLSRGFTLIEMLVTLGIFVLMGGITLAKYPQFSGKMVLENVAHQVGLSMREAQTYSLGVREFFVGTNVFPAYGLHFSLSQAGGLNDPSDTSTYLLFADTAGSNNKRYDGLTACGTGGECVSTNKIQSGDRISVLCGDLKARGGTLLNPNGADCDLVSLDIAYTRPNPDASVYGCKSPSSCRFYSDGSVFIESPRGDYKSIIAWPTGQIAIEDATVSAPTPTVSISASPTSVSYGGASTLTWSSTDATTCGASGSWSGTKSTSGSEIISNLVTSGSYTLTCTGLGGSGQGVTTVTVGSPQAPTVNISVNPISGTSPVTSTLSWSSANATSCMASANPSNGNWTGSKGLFGQQSTGSLSQTTTFTLTCTGAGGQSAGNTTVTVNQGAPVPVVTISISPNSGASGRSGTITWSSIDATSCTASANPSRGNWNGSKGLFGQQSTGSLSQTTTFTLTCTGAGGQGSNNATYTVNAVPTANISANPTSVSQGGSTTITWSSTNATSCTASGDWGGTKVTGGNQVMSNLTAGTKTYRIVCSGPGGQSPMRTVNVNVSSGGGGGGGGSMH